MNPFTSIMAKRPKKNKFDLSHERKFSCDHGQLVPIMCQEVLPGDSFRVQSEIMLRYSPLVAPVMHRIDVYTHYFFVPNRLVWNEWEDFITGGEDGNASPTFPVLQITNANKVNLNKGTLADYFGIPVTGTPTVNTTYSINALPFKAYQLIYNEFYRDQNLTAKVDINIGSGGISGSDIIPYTTMRTRAWAKDYFTSALPWSQRGGEAVVPLGQIDDNSITWKQPALAKRTADGGNAVGSIQAKTGGDAGKLSTEGTDEIFIENIDRIDLAPTTINDLRKAARLQEWLEKSARGGARYIEQILSHFGVKSSDARLQRPQYLGGGRSPVVISETLSTAQTEQAAQTLPEPAQTASIPQGNMAGHGISVGSHNGFKRGFEEHGWIIGIMSVLPKAAYQQGLEKHWRKFDKFDYYWPSFAHLGEQEVNTSEIYFTWTETGQVTETFGYQQRYAEYKYGRSIVAGDFRDDLDYWHMGRKFGEKPQLNTKFVEYDDDKRIFAVRENVQSLYCQVYNRVSALRPIPYFSIPEL